MVFQESAGERFDPLGQIRRELELEATAMERDQDKQNEMKETQFATEPDCKKT